jgi:hypothetical protein
MSLGELSREKHRLLRLILISDPCGIMKTFHLRLALRGMYIFALRGRLITDFRSSTAKLWRTALFCRGVIAVLGKERMHRLNKKRKAIPNDGSALDSFFNIEK